MIKNDIQIDKKEQMEFKPLPENIYQVELLDVTDEQRPTYDTKNKPEEEQEIETVLKFQFTLLKGKDGDEDLRGRNVWEGFVPTYLYEGKKGKNKLYQIVESLLGRNLTLEDEAKMDGEFINGLIGKQCRVGIKNKNSGDKVYSNIETFYPAEEDLTPLTEEEKEKATVKKEKEEENKEDDDLDNIEFPKDEEEKDF